MKDFAAALNDYGRETFLFLSPSHWRIKAVAAIESIFFFWQTQRRTAVGASRSIDACEILLHPCINLFLTTLSDALFLLPGVLKVTFKQLAVCVYCFIVVKLRRFCIPCERKCWWQKSELILLASRQKNRFTVDFPWCINVCILVGMEHCVTKCWFYILIIWVKGCWNQLCFHWHWNKILKNCQDNLPSSSECHLQSWLRDIKPVSFGVAWFTIPLTDNRRMSYASKPLRWINESFSL